MVEAPSVPLLATKFHIPPVRPSLVLRRRLAKLLTLGLAGRLILLSAPSAA